MTKQEKRRLWVTLVVGIVLILAAIVAFDERQSYIQDAAAEGLSFVQAGGETQGYSIRTRR
jgi:hypothetical protein